MAKAAQISADEAMLADSQRAQLMFGVMAAAAIVLGLCAALLITSLIVVPLRQTVGFAERIAAGDLSQDIAHNRRDELGQLLAAMQGMTSSLRTLVGCIDGGVGQIAAAEEQSSVAGAINESVTRVRDIGEQSAAASQQTAASSAELARLGASYRSWCGSSAPDSQPRWKPPSMGMMVPVM